MKIKSRDNHKQEIAVVKLATNQSISCHKSSISCDIPSEIPDLNKASLTGALKTAEPHTKAPDHLSRRQGIFMCTDWKKLLGLPYCILDPNIMNSVLSGLSFNLFTDNHFLTSSRYFSTCQRTEPHSCEYDEDTAVCHLHRSESIYQDDFKINYTERGGM